MRKVWVSSAHSLLESCFDPFPHEINELDWKQTLSPNKERIKEHLSAFSNESGGGILIFGIRDSDGQPLGITKAQSDQIVSQLASIGRDGLEPPIVIDHAVIEFRNVHLLAIQVKESKTKPVRIRGKGMEHSFIRSGGTSRKVSHPELGTLLLNSQTPRWETLRASPLMTAHEVSSALDTRIIHELLERNHPQEPLALMEWLASENFVEADSDRFFITNLGAISAARRLSDFPTLERKRLRVIRYRGLNKVDTISELVGQKGYAVGFEGLISHLVGILPRSEVIKDALRTEVAVYPEIALRELIANALVHQDFTIGGTGPMIEIFDNRISVFNPGVLPVSKRIDRLIGATPESRNETLASSFRRFRICEERGTGFQKVVALTELFGLPPVSFEQGDNFFRVTLYSPRQFSEMAHTERIEACYQHAVLRHLSSGSMTNTSLRVRLKMGEKQRPQVSSLIAEAVEAQRVKRKDPKSGSKFAEYVPYWA